MQQQRQKLLVAAGDDCVGLQQLWAFAASLTWVEGEEKGEQAFGSAALLPRKRKRREGRRRPVAVSGEDKVEGIKDSEGMQWTQTRVN